MPFLILHPARPSMRTRVSDYPTHPWLAIHRYTCVSVCIAEHLVIYHHPFPAALQKRTAFFVEAGKEWSTKNHRAKFKNLRSFNSGPRRPKRLHWAAYRRGDSIPQSTSSGFSRTASMTPSAGQQITLHLSVFVCGVFSKWGRGVLERSLYTGLPRSPTVAAPDSFESGVSLGCVQVWPTACGGSLRLAKATSRRLRLGVRHIMMAQRWSLGPRARELSLAFTKQL